MASSSNLSSSTMFNASCVTLAKTFCGSSLSEAKNLAVPMWRIRKLKINCEATSTNTVVATPETVKRVVDIVANQLATSTDSINPHSKFQDLGADSLDQVEIVMALEEEFNISVSENGAESISTVQDAADLIERAVSEKS